MNDHTSGPARPASVAEAPILPLAAPIAAAVAASGLSRSTLYREAGRGKIILLKNGRTTLVDMASVRAFLDALPRARIRPPKATTGRTSALAATSDRT